MAGLEDKNLFMMCEALNPAVPTSLSATYYVRTCRTDALDIWKAMHFDSSELAIEFAAFMPQYFDDGYADQDSEFFKRYVFVCDRGAAPTATGLGWKAYEHVSTLHCF